jgi:zinc transporter
VRAQKWIAACEQIPAQARELLLDSDSHIRMETAGRGFAGVLGDLHFEFDADPDRLGVMRLYVDENIVVTARLHPLKAADRLRLEARGGVAFASTMSLVIRFVEDVTDILSSVAASQGEIVDEIEDRVLKDRFLRESEELGRVRRLLARARRHIDAQRHALGHLAHRPPAWFRDKDTQELHRSIERLGAVSQDVESIQERARLLQEEIAGRLGKATNYNLYVVSLLTAIFLPITLITGVFGVNVGGLPGVEQDTGFAWVIGLMILTVATSLLLLHWRRFF